MSADFTSKFETQSQLLLVEKKLRSMLTSNTEIRSHEENLISRKEIMSQMRIMQEHIRSLQVSIGLIKVTLDILYPVESVSAHVLMSKKIPSEYKTGAMVVFINFVANVFL